MLRIALVGISASFQAPPRMGGCANTSIPVPQTIAPAINAGKIFIHLFIFLLLEYNLNPASVMGKDHTMPTQHDISSRNVYYKRVASLIAFSDRQQGCTISYSSGENNTVSEHRP
ncbi:MAG: hypothetical protein NTY46_01870 [Candidatus Sumerlaeota bacterium]|nr:hypothetical protein [Candidatus Sumerlaeota bacterium]